ncbi:MAG: bifunctional hydroxymethylpyrimidine kinase/phosphomethylpyrimidine kinase [Novosphingobium sp.]|nr:bifunctional hydroxymethylpyrimidine kinase/phosphomethylpyrimidine kinase [Novosphingobium sp.]
MSAPPRILSIAGSDSSGGAGIQADIKTITMLGGYAMTAITAVTAQNTQGVTAVKVLSPDMVAAQIDACVSDIGVDAVKIGMLGSAGIADAVADRLVGMCVPIVFDPVMVATSGSVLADEATIAAFERLMALATLTTPNTEELASLSGSQVTNETEQGDAAGTVMARTGASAILAKGGHLILKGETYGVDPEGNAFRYDNSSRVFDFLYEISPQGFWSERNWDSLRIHTRHTHGTGCTLSSAIATYLGMGVELTEAIDKARQFVRAALEAAPGFGSGHGPMGHQAVRDL